MNTAYMERLIWLSVRWLGAVASWLKSDPMLLLFTLICMLFLVRAFKTLVKT